MNDDYNASNKKLIHRRKSLGSVDCIGSVIAIGADRRFLELSTKPT